MKKLIFRNFTKDTLNFFLIMCLIIGTIVWTLQAVNYFDFVSQDGHGLSTYFSYILFNFPKIIHRIIPFIFFISLFYILNEYEFRNELQIFWTFGITKISFAHKILLLSILLAIFQIWFGSFFSPLTQFKGRQLIKGSNLDFFTSLIKEGKFINVVEGLTIFIDKKNEDNSYSDIFLDDSSKEISKIIIAKNGNIIDSNNQKIFRLFDGKVINKDKKKINIFEFDQIDFNLADYTSNTIIEPKIQEMPSTHLLNCSVKFFQTSNFLKKENFNCDKSVENEMHQELLKRFYKPIYIPIIAILSCFLIIFPKNNFRHNKFKKIIFTLTFFILVLSEASLRYSTSSKISVSLYVLMPLMIFIIFYTIFYKRVKNV